MRHTTSRALGVFVAAAVVVTALGGCGITVPTDPDGTLESVQGGELRAGVSPNGGLVAAGAGEPSGDEVEAIRAFAASLDAEVRWTIGSEETLVRGLEEGSLDLVAGGITDETPWTDDAGVTRPYREVTDARGRTHRLVMLVPLGENAFLSALETFLGDHASREAQR
jgi:ABC-type amino acid transport substrate-binding protein